MENMVMKSLLVLYSYHHNNTEKIANIFAKVLDAQIKTPQQIDPEELQEYDLLGFGSGIDSDKHYQVLLDFAHEGVALTRNENRLPCIQQLVQRLEHGVIGQFTRPEDAGDGWQKPIGEKRPERRVTRERIEIDGLSLPASQVDTCS